MAASSGKGKCYKGLVHRLSKGKETELGGPHLPVSFPPFSSSFSSLNEEIEFHHDVTRVYKKVD